MTGPIDPGASRNLTRAERRRRQREINERPTARELGPLTARQDALIRSMAGLPVPDLGVPIVVLLSESSEPAYFPWPLLPAVILIGAGIELHPDTLAMVDRIVAAGEVPALTRIDGWINVHSLTVAPLVAGGEA